MSQANQPPHTSLAEQVLPMVFTELPELVVFTHKELPSPESPTNPFKQAPHVFCTLAHAARFRLEQTGALLQLTALITVLPTAIAFLVPSVLPALEVS